MVMGQGLPEDSKITHDGPMALLDEISLTCSPLPDPTPWPFPGAPARLESSIYLPV